MSRTHLTYKQYQKQRQDFLSSLPADESLPAMRMLCRTDLAFLLWEVMGRKDLDDPWHYDRIREVQTEPDGHIDLWAREHGKSSIITLGKTLQDILASHGQDPLPEWKGVEPCFIIFAYTRPLAKAFLRQLQHELMNNEMLRLWFPDVLHDDPGKESPRWSLDEGLVVKRKSNRKEGTIEASGLIDGQPTGKHFDVVIYDDVVVLDSVRTVEAIKKTTEAWSMSLNLGVHGGRWRYIGTRYHSMDTYAEILKREVAKPRIYPATVDGTVEGEPALWDRETLEQKRKQMGPYIFACQMLQNPLADSGQSFKPEWFERYHHEPKWGEMTRIILVDPANSKKRWGDYTVMWCIARGEDDCYYILDGVRDRLNLKERAAALFDMHRKFAPCAVGYESYSMQADTQYLKEMQDRESYRFPIIELGGHKLSKEDRIKRLVPLFADAQIIFPSMLQKHDYQGLIYDMTETFYEEEFLMFPVATHDDGLDALSRIADDEVQEILKKPSRRRWTKRERERLLESLPRPVVI